MGARRAALRHEIELMPPQVAALLFVAFILWLLARDAKRRGPVSPALWLPSLWVMIVGSRPVSQWFGGSLSMESPDEYLKGSPVDMAIFLAQIVAGGWVLSTRKINWSRLVAANGALAIFLLYGMLSLAWSDYPFVGLKRWIKDLGNLVMVLVILTESDPARAAQVVFARCAYVLIPLSVLFIKYYPDFGRYYSKWTWEPIYCGVTTEKNALGCLVLVCGMFQAWELFNSRIRGAKPAERFDLLGRGVLLLMSLWLMSKANSSTALVCWAMGVGLIWILRFPFALRQVRHLGTYAMAVASGLFLLYAVPGVLEMMVGMLGEDMTFTGRTDLWRDLLGQSINPLMGTGYQSFWLGERAEVMWEKYYFHPNQAHNGYIETYLNGGFLGVAALAGLLISCGAALKRELIRRVDFARIRFAALVVAIFYNWTEAMFNRMSLIWIVLLLAAVRYPAGKRKTAAAASPRPLAARGALPAPGETSPI